MSLGKYWYTIPYRRNMVENQTMTWDRSLFSSPCICCGNEEHALLRLKLDRLGYYEDASFSCPVIHHEEVEDMLEESLMSRKYAPDPEKIATICLRDQTNPQIIFDEIRERGAALHMHTNQWETIQRKVLERMRDKTRVHSVKVRKENNRDNKWDGMKKDTMVRYQRDREGLMRQGKLKSSEHPTRQEERRGVCLERRGTGGRLGRFRLW